MYNITVGWNSFAEYHETELTAPICLEFLYKDKNMLYIFPTCCLTEELFLLIVNRYGENLKIIPEEYKTIRVCCEAVKNTSHALVYCPKIIDAGTLLWTELLKISDEAILYCDGFETKDMISLHKMLWEV